MYGGGTYVIFNTMGNFDSTKLNGLAKHFKNVQICEI